MIIISFNKQIKFMTFLIKAFNKLGVFIDLPKAFDTIDHKILLKKHSQYGIKNKGLYWFTCHLFNRKQFVGYNVNSKATFNHSKNV